MQAQSAVAGVTAERRRAGDTYKQAQLQGAKQDRSHTQWGMQTCRKMAGRSRFGPDSRLASLPAPARAILQRHHLVASSTDRAWLSWLVVDRVQTGRGPGAASSANMHKKPRYQTLPACTTTHVNGTPQTDCGLLGCAGWVVVPGRTLCHQLWSVHRLLACGLEVAVQRVNLRGSGSAAQSAAA